MVGSMDRRVIRVLVADDHPLYRQAVASAIDLHPGLAVVASATGAHTALAGIEQLRPDVALVDLRMPGDAIAMARTVRGRRLSTRVLFLSEHTGGREVYAAVSAGARGYLAKDAQADEIRQAVLAVARGETRFSSAAEEALVAVIHRQADLIRPHLSDREREILTLAADGRSNAEIAGALHLSPETIKTHLRTVFEKLGVPDRTAAVAWALRSALIT